MRYENLEEEKEDKEEKEIHPEEKTWEIFRIFVYWLSPLVDKAFLSPIQETEIYEAPLSFEISLLSQQLSKQWEIECSHHQNLQKTSQLNQLNQKNQKNEQPSLLRALYVVFKKDLFQSGRYTLLFTTLQLIQPYLIGHLLDEISSSNGTIQSGLLAALPLGIVAILSSSSLITTVYHLRRTGLLIRGSIMMNVYSHALILTNSSRHINNIGTTANLMSIDSEKLVMASIFIHYLW